MLHVVLFQPEIPGNTGNIIRLCANTGASLHLIEPLGFVMEDAKLRRAGLDYHEWARVQRHVSLEACLASLGNPRWFAFTTKASRPFHEVSYQPGDVLVFGPETRGLPMHVLDQCSPEHRVRLPMRAESRSLNLSNAAAVAVYEVWRQQGFPGGQ